MYCPRCRSEISDNSIVCPNCGEHFAVELQMIKCKQARNRSMQIISDMFHSKLFLVFSIFLSILCGSSIMSAFSLSLSLDTYNASSSVNTFKILIFVFSLIGTITAWKIYSSKQLPAADQIKKLRMLPVTIKIMQTVFYISLIVLLSACLIFLASSSVWIEELKAQNIDIMGEVANALLNEGIITQEQFTEIATFDIDAYIVPIIIILCVIIAIALATSIILAIAFKKTTKYLTGLETTLRTGRYEISSAPSKILFVMGIISAAGGASLITTPMNALYSLSLGGYMITLSLIMKKLHAAQLQNNQAIHREEEKLAYIARRTNEYFAAANAQPQYAQPQYAQPQYAQPQNIQDPDITA